MERPSLAIPKRFFSFQNTCAASESTRPRGERGRKSIVSFESLDPARI